MSRVGKNPVALPTGVTVKVDGNLCRVKGPKGELETPIVEGTKVEVADGSVQVSLIVEQPRLRAVHGLVRALLQNAIDGVTSGFDKTLEIKGVGYRAEVKGRDISFALGYSHPVIYPLPDGIDVDHDPKANRMVLKGIDKQLVGQVAAEIRSLRPPDVYKGKGIRYANEVVRKKAGKAGAR